VKDQAYNNSPVALFGKAPFFRKKKNKIEKSG
jgi:hypothetical protein